MLPGRARRQGQAMAVPAGGPRGVAPTPPHPCPGQVGSQGSRCILALSWSQTRRNSGKCSYLQVLPVAAELQGCKDRVLQGSQGPTSNAKRE